MSIYVFCTSCRRIIYCIFTLLNNLLNQISRQKDIAANTTLIVGPATGGEEIRNKTSILSPSQQNKKVLAEGKTERDGNIIRQSLPRLRRLILTNAFFKSLACLTCPGFIDGSFSSESQSAPFGE